MSDNILLRSFYKYLKGQCLKLIPNIKEEFLNKPEKILFVLKRYQSMFLKHCVYNIIETPTFKNCLLSISDKQILKKINILKEKLSVGDNGVLDNKKNKKERFVSDNFNGFFDAEGTAVTDFLLDTAQIMHFHVGYNKNTSDILLFAYVADNNIYFICIGSHKDLYIDASQSFIFDSFYKELPIAANHYFPMLHCEELSYYLDYKGAKKFKTNAINSAFKDSNGKIRAARVNYTLNRMPSYIADDLINIIREFELYTLKEEYSEKKLKVIALEFFNNKYCILLRDINNLQNQSCTLIYVNKKTTIAQIINFLEDIRKKFDFPSNSTIELLLSRANSRKNRKRTGWKKFGTHSQQEILNAIVNRRPQ